ncbi:Elongation of very long chain fatty acids protein 7 [Eumeta japonica]|uniref:Elongation of very long chain fatty acids protein n=1 Tax=Eumeta variegata TaxID=151549 RepID=A0A4C1Z6I0_EUMVA|nr:Elongation of very long chain fatty acids protein 7 [Eumeta japonica]
MGSKLIRERFGLRDVAPKGGKVDLVDSWWLMGSPFPVLIILGSYLLFVLRIGPQYMNKREPFQLKTLLILYNAAQVLFSLYLSIQYLQHLLKHGFLPSKCLMNDDHTRIEIKTGLRIKSGTAIQVESETHRYQEQERDQNRAQDSDRDYD